MHMLQLPVQEKLKQCKAIHRHVKSLQTFFQFPKQAQQLYEVQLRSNTNEDTVESPLDVLTDVKTKQNFIYLAWKHILELHNSIRYVSTSLLFTSDHTFQIESEKLKRLCLTVDKKG